MYSTDNPNKTVRVITTKMKKKIRKYLYNQRDLYDTANTLQQKNYKTAWDNAFGEDSQSVVISLGGTLQSVFESVGEQNIISKRDIDKVLTSYFYSSASKEYDELLVEQNGTKLGRAIVDVFDGVKITPFQRRMNILKGNRIIEGKPV